MEYDRTRDFEFDEAVENLRRICNATGWTPTFAGKPDEDSFVLITVAPGTRTDMGTATCNQVMFAHYSTEDGVDKSFQTIGYGDVFLNDEVLAWMPIPKPWEEP